MRRHDLRVIICLFLVLALTACQREETVPEPGYVEANPAYLGAFGPPPAVKSGKAYARVGYLPSRQVAGQVGAVPLFLFDASGQLPRILLQLVGNVLVLPPGSPLYDPFPPGSNIQVVSHEARSLKLALRLEGPFTLDPTPLLLSLAETALQFEDIDEVSVVINNREFGPYVHLPERIIGPAPPDVVMVAGILDAGVDTLEEIVVNFDRPVKVNTFRFSHPDGSEVAGQYFTSVFQMAIVVHPENPAFYRDGTELVVDWQVTDYLGRVGAGHRATPLRFIVHEAALGDFDKK